MQSGFGDALGSLLRAPRRLRGLVPRSLRPRVRRAYYATVPSSALAPVFAETFRSGAETASREGSDLYGELLERAASDVEARGPCWHALETFAPSASIGEPMVAWRFMAAVHRIVLEGDAEPLARHYPSVGGRARPGEAWEPFLEVVAANRDRIRELLALPVQTNEVGRSRALVGGFLQVAGTYGSRLRVLELGASAGLNLRWDHYRYERASGPSWGDPGSPVRFADCYTGVGPAFDVTAEVVARSGCDIAPIDATSAEGRLSLASYVRADDTERFTLLEQAIAVARLVPARVDRASATDWLPGQLAEPASGVATVVFESYVWKYLPPADQAALEKLLGRVGARATLDAPLALLRMGCGRREDELLLTTWPGGTTTTLAVADQYGRSVRWLAAAPRPAR